MRNHLSSIILASLFAAAVMSCSQQVATQSTLAPAVSIAEPTAYSQSTTETARTISFPESLPLAVSQEVVTTRFKATFPKEISVWCGFREMLPLTLMNQTSQSQTVQILAKTSVNVFIDGKTAKVGSENALFSIANVTVPANGQITQSIELQSLRLGNLEVLLSLDDRQFTLNVNAKVRDRGAGLMYRCWSESNAFFDVSFGGKGGQISRDQKKEKAKQQYKEEMRAGKSKDEARRDALKSMREDYSEVSYSRRSNWETAYQRKKDLHNEQNGFYYTDIDGLSWGTVEYQKDSYNWSIGDFMLDLNNKVLQGTPFVRIDSAPGWAMDFRGPSGHPGFYDANNKVLMDTYQNFCTALAERYDGDGIEDAPDSPIVNHYILANEPTLFWFSVDFDRNGNVIQSGGEGIEATRWFKDALREGGYPRVSQAYVNTFGDITFASIRRAAEAIHAANPQAKVCTHQFVPGKFGSPDMAMFKYLLDKGVGKYVDAWGYHPGNAFSMMTLWKQNTEVPYTVDDACYQAPPFATDGLNSVVGALNRRGMVLETARPIEEITRDYPYMGKAWRTLIDEPYSQPLEDLSEMLNRYNLSLPVWVTESIMIGPMATNRRENLLASLHEYTILFHEKVEITTIASVLEEGEKSGNVTVGYVPDPTARDLLINMNRAIGGAAPVEKMDCKWFVPGEDKYLDYGKTVYKLFNRGDEDIIAIWNNSGKDEVLEFNVASGIQLSDIRMMKFDADSDPFLTENTLSSFPSSLKIKPLKQFYYISVRSNQPKFGWLTGARRQISPDEAQLLDQYKRAQDYIENARGSMRGGGRGDARNLREQIDRALKEADDAITMGDYNRASSVLDRIKERLQ
jgi:hypothetical protein